MANNSNGIVDSIELQSTPEILPENSSANESEIQSSNQPNQDQTRLSNCPGDGSLHLSGAMTPNNDNAPLLQQKHRCEKREDYHRIWNRVYAWYLFPLHLVLSIAFTVTLVFVLNDTKFGVGETDVMEFYRNGLYQTEITT